MAGYQASFQYSLMTASRKALTLSLAYSLPLLAWLYVKLKGIEWGFDNPQAFFNQALSGFILLQALATALIYLNHAKESWHEELSGIGHILLFPLPFLTLAWLTGSLSLSVIFKSFLLVGSVGALTFLIRLSLNPAQERLQLIEIIASLLHILLAIAIWNYRGLWWHWLEL
jgi:hypothetical protein